MQVVFIVNQRTSLCMIQLLMKEVTGEISGFNKEILIYLSESCRFFYIQICIQFYYLEQLSLFYDFLDQKFYILYVYVPENNVSHTLAQFFFSIKSYT